jgi:hypothetical protein
MNAFSNALRSAGLFAGCAAVALVAARLGAAEPIAPGQFEALHAILQPKQTEQAWMQIPWRTSLWEAREIAAREGKPILLWEMDGHPLGCT